MFDSNYPPTSLHRLFARLPALLREQGRPQLLLLTTNYDDLLERALAGGRGGVDVVWYEAKRGPLQGRFLHRPPAGDVVPIERPNEYTGSRLDERPVVLKLHGAVDRTNAKSDSYVITEDSYIDYLVGGDVGGQIPFALLERMADSHFLFLGYSMRDWNLRVILNRIWGAQQLDLKSWAVQRAPADARRARGRGGALARPGRRRPPLRPAQGLRRPPRAGALRAARMSEDSVIPERPGDPPLSPYVGLVPYGEQDAAFFFGRADETRIVSGNLRASDLTLLYGASGVGKTSLLRAGRHPRAPRAGASDGACAVGAGPLRGVRLLELARQAASGADGDDPGRDCRGSGERRAARVA